MADMTDKTTPTQPEPQAAAAPAAAPPVKDKTTMGDRLSTGAVQAGLWGGSSILGSLAVNGVRKMLSKGKDIKLMSGLDWKLAGGIALVAGLVSAVFANGPKERQQAKKIEDAILVAGDKTNSLTKKERETLIEQTINGVEKDKNPAFAQSTKYQDMVTAARAAAEAEAAQGQSGGRAA
jgi:hypothetical protein